MPQIILGKRIIAAAMPRMATADPFNAQPKPFRGAIPGNRFGGVLGARWRKPAVCPEHGADRVTVSIDNPNQNTGHLSFLLKAASSGHGNLENTASNSATSFSNCSVEKPFLT